MSLIEEIHIIQSHFALIDQCQNLGRNGYSVKFCGAMNMIEPMIKNNLKYEESKELFEKLSNIFFGHMRDL